MNRITPTLLICAAGALISGVALARPADPPSSASSAEVTPVGAGAVVIKDFAFSVGPAVDPGAQIDISNADGVAHTLTSDDDFFDTGNIDGGATSGIVAPDAAGTYSYFCVIHPSMTGSITVAE